MSRVRGPRERELWSAQAMLAPSWPEAMLPAHESAKRGFAGRKREHGSRTPQSPWLMADR